MTRALPPFGRSFLPVPRSGLRVACGRTGWEFAESHLYPIMVLPYGDDPRRYRWPSDRNPALIYERGSYDDNQLDSLASQLLKAGASSVVAIRETLVNDSDPRVFYEKEVMDVAQ